MIDRKSTSEKLARYAAGVLDRPLPDRAVERASLHILDTLAATVAGADLDPGRAGQAYLRSIGDINGQITVVGTGLRATVTGAALANGMSAHADETDDSHEFSQTHPGCGNVSAAISAAEFYGRSGAGLLRAVTFGYDAGTRFVRSVGLSTYDVDRPTPASHSVGNVVGAAHGAGSLARLDQSGFVDLMSYVVQEVSGMTTWLYDEQHVLKAYVFSGMTASTGVRLAAAVAAGWPGGGDVYMHPTRAVLDCFGGPDSDFSILTDGLGEEFAICETNIKRYSVGSPVQAVIQALDALIADHDFDLESIAQVRVHLHATHAPVVDQSRMPAVNVQFCVASTLIEGRLAYVTSHDSGRLRDPKTKAVMELVRVIGDLKPPVRREATVEIILKDGRTLSQHEDNVLGTYGRPMSVGQISEKALELMDPFLGSKRVQRVCELVLNLDDLPRVSTLTEELALNQS